MNKLYKYIFGLILGIILYIDNTINKFSIGIPPKRPLNLCAGYVNTDEDIDSNSDSNSDIGYHTANSYEPPNVGYIFQGNVIGTDPLGQWYFTTEAPPYDNFTDLEGNLINWNHPIYYISPAPNENVIETTLFFDPNTLYIGMDKSFKELLNIVVSSIYNLSRIR